jgi:hypothetical protein
VSDRLLAHSSSFVSSMPAAAAAIAIRVAVQAARPARISQPGVTWSPVPPSSPGMSVVTSMPFA